MAPRDEPCPAGGRHQYHYQTAAELDDGSGRRVRGGYYCEECNHGWTEERQ